MNSDDLRAIAFLRRMRGTSQATLLEASNGKEYVVKSPDNPNGRRTLINEWLGYRILAELNISTPEIRIISISKDFLTGSPEMYHLLGHKRVPLQPGLHLASEHVGSCKRPAFDLLPAPILWSVDNLADFLGALVADKWLANTDARQCVFAKDTVTPEARGWRAHMIDHGQLLDGRHWAFRDAALFGLYLDHSVYAGVGSWAAFEPWMEQVNNLDEAFLKRVTSALPREWIDNDQSHLDRLMETVTRRRGGLPRFIQQLRDSPISPFTRWTTTVVGTHHSEHLSTGNTINEAREEEAFPHY